MKKFLFSILCLLVAAGSLAQESGTTGDCTWSFDSTSGQLTISGNGAMADYNNDTEQPWYFFRTAIQTVVIHPDVKSIGDWAFYICTALTAVTIGNSVASIGDWAFAFCTGLTSVTIPNSVETIGAYAFAYCPDLILTIGNRVTSIGGFAFADCTGLTAVTIPNSVTTIEDGAFWGCTGLTEIQIKNSTPLTISWAVFYEVNKETCTLYVPAGSYGAYRNADGWSEFENIIEELIHVETAGTLPSLIAEEEKYLITDMNLTGNLNGTDIRYIREMAGRDVDGAVTEGVLTTLNLADANIVSGGDYYFQSYVTYYTSNDTIGAYTFQNCSGLTSVILPNSVTSIGSSAFSQCTSLTTVIIPNCVTTIGSSAFSQCTSLTTVTIGDHVTTIGESAFNGCSGLTAIHANKSTPLTINSNVFQDVNKTTCKLYVPTGAADAYRNAEGWGEFENIIEELTLHVETAGTLSALIPTHQKYQITDLTLTGNLNGTDIRYIREMAGSDVDGAATEGVLTTLNLADANIVSGGDYYLQEWGNTYYTSDNTIGDQAFYGCMNLTYVILPNSVILIGYKAFLGTGLTAVTLGNRVAAIDNQAFLGCTGLIEFFVSEHNTEYAAMDGVLFNKNTTTLIAYPNAKATTYTIPESVTAIGDQAFYGCGLTAVTIPESVNTIGDLAFYECTGLTEIHNKKAVPQSIDSWVFYGVNKTTCTLYVPIGAADAYRSADGWSEFLNIIEEGTLHVETAGTLPALISENQKYLITDLTLTGDLNGTDLRYIREMAGRDVTGAATEGVLTALNLADANIVSGGDSYFQHYYTSDDTIGEWAFSGCSGLTAVTIPNSVTTIGVNAFQSCTGLTAVTIGDHVTTIGRNAFQDCTGLMAVAIPNSVTTIGVNAFQSCTGLTAVTIGDHVTTIVGSDIFRNCTGLTEFSVSEQNTTYSAIDGVLFSKDKTTLVLFPYAKATIYTIPEGVTTIGVSAFSGCSGLTSVTIPNSVTSIGRSAFTGCSGLTAVTIPNNVTTIGQSAFLVCTGLASVTIPNSVTSIGSSAFAETPWLDSQPDGLVYAGRVLYIYKGTMPANTSINIQEGTVSITDAAFFGCTGLTAVTIPSSVTSIGIAVFADCTGLMAVTIPESVTTIGDITFVGCTGLTAVTIPSSVTSIGRAAFAGCTGLTEIHVKNPTPPNIGGETFSEVNTETCKLYVPTGAVDAYRNAEVWSEFLNIIGEDVTVLNPISKDNGNVAIHATTNGITIDTQEAAHVVIFNIAGQQVYQAVIHGSVEIALSKGVYIVRAGKESHKVLVQ